MGSLVAELAEKLSSATNNFDIDEGTIYVNTSADTVAIGGTSPDGKFSIHQSASADILNLYDGTDVVFTVLDGGKVGIGTTAPTSQLEVVNTSYTSSVIGGKLRHGVTFQIEESAQNPSTAVAYSTIDKAVTFGVQRNKNSGTYNDGWTMGLPEDSKNFQISKDTLGTALTIDTSGHIGIGTTEPSNQVDIGHPSGPALRFTRTDSTIVADELIGTIEFGGDDPSAGASGARIRGYAEGAWASSDYASYLIFQTTPTSSGSPTERVRINSAGEVGIGTTSPSELLCVVSREVGSEGGIGLWNYHSSQKYNIQTGVSGAQNTSFTIKDDTADAVRMVILSDGKVGIGTSAPVYLLNVKTSIATWVSQFENSSTSGNVYALRLKFNSSPDDNTSKFFECADSTGDKVQIFSDGDIKNHDGIYGTISDERIKTDIIDANSQWDDIKAVRVRNFKRKDDVAQYGDKAWSQIGVVAQELEKVSPKLVKEHPPSEWEMEHCGFGKKVGGKWVPKQVGGKDMTVKGVSTSILYMKAFKALQEAMAKIETLEAKVKTLEDAG